MKHVHRDRNVANGYLRINYQPVINQIIFSYVGYTEHLATGFQGTVTNPGQIAVGLYSGMWSYEGW